MTGRGRDRRRHRQFLERRKDSRHRKKTSSRGRAFSAEDLDWLRERFSTLNAKEGDE